MTKCAANPVQQVFRFAFFHSTSRAQRPNADYKLVETLEKDVLLEIKTNKLITSQIKVLVPFAKARTQNPLGIQTIHVCAACCGHTQFGCVCQLQCRCTLPQRDQVFTKHTKIPQPQENCGVIWRHKLGQVFETKLEPSPTPSRAKIISDCKYSQVLWSLVEVLLVMCWRQEVRFAHANHPDPQVIRLQRNVLRSQTRLKHAPRFVTAFSRARAASRL